MKHPWKEIAMKLNVNFFEVEEMIKYYENIINKHNPEHFEYVFFNNRLNYWKNIKGKMKITQHFEIEDAD